MATSTVEEDRSANEHQKAPNNVVADVSNERHHTIDKRSVSLFNDLETQFNNTKLGNARWYLTAIAALVGGGNPEAARDIYLYMTRKREFQSPASRQQLVRRLREALVKCIPIIGVCKPLEAIFAIKEVESLEDKDYSFSRQHWKSGEQNHQRGIEWMQQVYSRNLEDTLKKFDDHKDFGWISTDITYGLYLSDHSILDAIDTELVVLAGIMIQNTPRETWWHIRGTRRVGVSREDTETVYKVIRSVADFLGLKLDRIPTPEEVEHDV